MGERRAPEQGEEATAGDVLERVMAHLKARLGPEIVASWFQRLKIDEIEKGQVRFSVPTAFLRNWIRSHYLDLLTEIMAREVPGTLRVEIVVRSAMRAPGVTARKARVAGRAGEEIVARAGAPAAERTKTGDVAAPVRSEARPRAGTVAGETGTATGRSGSFGSPLDSRYTFENFVEGPSNRVAHAAARAIAEGNAQSLRFNPLFIHAAIGLGKTHLLQATANMARARADRPRVVYLTAEYFMWQFATAIRDNHALDLKETLHRIDILIIDDIQFLQGRTIQQEFCHLLNTLIDSARCVVCAGDRPASDLESLDSRVRSRLSNGITLELGMPDVEMRKALLRSRTEALREEDSSFELSPSAIDLIAHRVQGSGRDIEGAFNQLAFRHSLGQPLSAEHLDEFLVQISRGAGERRVRIDDILKFVSNQYNVSRTDILSARRTRNIVRPRQIAMYLAKTMTPRSLPEIGRRFGGRDHTTVLHAVRKIERERSEDKNLSEELDVIRRMIEE